MATKTVQEVDTVAALADLMARSGVKDRANVEKHLAICDAEPNSNHGKLWREIAGKLASLAPLPFKMGGNAMLFYIADGKYRMQVFAIEDRYEGQIMVYLPDVLAAAIRKKVISKSGDKYTAGGASGPAMLIDALDAANTPDPAAHLKHMIGWNRKAVRVTFNTTDAQTQQIAAVAGMCDLAATQWPAPPAA
ncbi:MAG TPA: hypothetical protein VHD56_14200 [Tepidisphaeraceae bacterium]|nr:hypothetical protein [Tepidisphaeraceae bacterium]